MNSLNCRPSSLTKFLILWNSWFHEIFCIYHRFRYIWFELHLLVSHSFQVFAHKNIAVACYASHLWEQQVHALSVSHILFTLQVDHKLSLLSVLSKVDIIRYFYLVIASCASCWVFILFHTRRVCSTSYSFMPYVPCIGLIMQWHKCNTASSFPVNFRAIDSAQEQICMSVSCSAKGSRRRSYYFSLPLSAIWHEHSCESL